MTDIHDRDEQGQIERQYSDDDILAAIKEHDPATTGEVAEETGMTYQNAAYRLDKLEEEGQILSKRVGANRVWMLSDGG